MGIVAFQWGENELTMFLNREKCDSWAIKPAAWDKDEKILRGMPEDNKILSDLSEDNEIFSGLSEDKEMLSGLPEDIEISSNLTEDMEILSYRTEDKQILSDLSLTEESLGTWFGISKKGRVVFLVDQVIKYGAFLWSPVDFLLGEMSPEDYAKQLSEFEPDSTGLVYQIIVADINTNSMFHISKKEAKEPKVVSNKVGFGVHTLSSIAGFDGKSVKELHMKNLFNEIIGDYKNQQVPPTLKEMAESFIYFPAEVNRDSEVGKKAFATVSTTALMVKPTKEVMFYERHLEENGDWKDVHNFTFKIV